MPFSELRLKAGTKVGIFDKYRKNIIVFYVFLSRGNGRERVGERL